MSYKITSNHTLEQFFASLRGDEMDGMVRMVKAVAFTIPIPVNREGGAYIWDGSSPAVHVRIDSLQRFDDDAKLPTGRWRFTGTIDSMYKGTDGRAVSGLYSFTEKGGVLFPE